MNPFQNTALAPFNPPRPFTLKIPAGKEVQKPVTGRYVYFKEANYSDFEIAFDLGSWVPFDLAMGYAVPDYMESFNQIRVRNNNAAELDVVMVICEGDVVDHRVNIINSRDGSAASFIPNIANYIGVATDAGARLPLPLDANRAKVIISADDPAVATTFTIYDAAAAGNVIAQGKIPAGEKPFEFVFKGACWLAATGGDLQATALCFG